MSELTLPRVFTSAPVKNERSSWLRLRRNFKFWLGLFLVLLIVVISLAAPLLTRVDPLAVDPTLAFHAPSLQHPMGTDNIGRDMWARFAYGGRISLEVGIVAILISSSLGVLAGVFAGYYGGWVDSLLSWITEVLMAFPGILLAMAVIAILGPGLLNVIVAVGIGAIPSFMRMARSAVMQTQQFEYITAARAIGCRDSRLLFRHILPNILQPLIVLATLGVGNAILEGSAFSFLGLGAQPPTPEWGAMLSAGRGFLARGWWISIFPGIGIFLTILGINLLGEGLNEFLDPKSRSMSAD
jgi:peptide/nickel transport system permease protein